MMYEDQIINYGSCLGTGKLPLKEKQTLINLFQKLLDAGLRVRTERCDNNDLSINIDGLVAGEFTGINLRLSQEKENAPDVRDVFNLYYAILQNQLTNNGVYGRC